MTFRERLHGIKLVVKTLGAGFHQPVDNVHSLSIVRKDTFLVSFLAYSKFI